jgi:SpoVK/Ycf46/Vps4 family AAA+-type ATPase
MATSEQLKYLIESHFQQDEERFTTTALQVAAHEARLGHSQVANEIRTLIDRRRSARAKVVPFRPELGELVLVEVDLEQRLPDLVASTTMRQRIARILNEFRQQAKLREHGLENRRKLLLCGPPGTGKTMTASVLAGELGLPLLVILMDKLTTKFMGETSAKLRQVFDNLGSTQGVYLFDEFDAIGAERSRENDVGEIRRVLNAFLQLIEHDRSTSLIIAATNNQRILDPALFRRFDDVISFHLPDRDEIVTLLVNRLGRFGGPRITLNKVADAASGLSHAEISLAVNDAIKDAILANRKQVVQKTLIAMLQERRSAQQRVAAP